MFLMMKLKSYFKATIHESLLTGILLAIVGGFLDIYTYILKGNVFANAQTGNIVLMGLKIAQSDFMGALYYLLPITAFFLGIVISEYIRHKFTNLQYLEWQHLILIIEIIILTIIAFEPKQLPHLICNVTIGLVCSLQVNAFKTTSGLPYASTMCTGNLKSAGQKLSAYLFLHDKNALKHCFRYLIIIFFFILGAIIATILINFFGQISLLFCCLLLLITLLILMY